MKPDFNKPILDILAKRAAYKCTNPDCRVSTVGPNENVNKATVIGEAAHIFGARPGSKRYQKDMTDLSRAEITNAIWLCRNCHKLIDSDENRFSSDLLFSWREVHEKFVLSELGNTSDKLISEEITSKVEQFKNYPPIIRRIVIDEPIGWEWRLASELLRFLNMPMFRKLEDLQNQLYTKPLKSISLDEMPNWVEIKLAEFQNLIPPFEGLLDKLTISFGEPGESGDLHEIHYICKLIQEYLSQVILFEESVNFVHVPNECKGAVNLLRNLIGSQAMKLKDIPDMLDEVVSLVNSEEVSGDSNSNNDTPMIIKKTIKLDVPDSWSSNFTEEMKKVYAYINESNI